MKDQAVHQKGCSRHPVAVILKGTDSERRKDAQACGCMKRFSSCGCSQHPEALWLSTMFLERVTRKQGTDSLAWEYWRVQGAEDAVTGTRAESLHALDLLVLVPCKLHLFDTEASNPHAGN